MKKILYITLCITLLAAGSCKKDFLNRPPLGVQTEENFYKSRDAGLRTLVKCYQVFNDAYGYEAPRAELGNMATDDSEKGGGDAGDRPFVTDLGYGRALSSNPSLQSDWATHYQGIGNCNVALENLPVNELIDAAGAKVTANTKARYLAEIRFIRAYLYFELVKTFGGVPLLDKTLTVNNANKLKRATAKEIFEFIAKELDAVAAETSLPGKNGMDYDKEAGRVNKEAVWAMQARVYLYFAKNDNGLFAKARDAAKKVIDANVYSLDKQFQDLYLVNSYKTQEPIFSIIKGDNAASNIYGAFTPLYTSPRGPTGAYGFDTPTQDLVSEFEPGDPRLLFTIIEPGDAFPKASGQEVLNFSSYPNTGFHNRKSYLTPLRRGPGFGDDAWTFHLIRYADVLLMYAEAVLESGGDKQTVANYINMIRQRASNSTRTDAEAVSRVRTIANTPLPDVTVGADLRVAVRHERRIEFAMEYQRLFDLQRWNNYIETMNNYAGKPGSNGKGAAFKKGINELFPIPQAEIDRSGGSIVQNPGY
ncbi:RagB/SusD family nutrient uptake outer membrane protein [Mucilaginibacter sp. RB4R14]|uniref:RagB/SusD family nutrient uptake outer membrane protein n=1 Tax=Mucilaginibacter aurantiaciroseus TaxID=2949308 RepID=UPI0020903473|nr:RagB/SusD family nutrient uptake outer membrane protein [Mucilaginibacter aurantiaciroseus]MCO5936670.1 RagB/SusD family nutrient uptake outer membrane protein [Mucilaginibacter aurantiaciroseus]